MGSVPPNVGVFFGQVDKRSEGWYWADSKSEKPRTTATGPFETKEHAIENALQSLANPQEVRGAA
jgi:hypothetical protein